jgi:hypothetical protein
VAIRDDQIYGIVSLNAINVVQKTAIGRAIQIKCQTRFAGIEFCATKTLNVFRNSSRTGISVAAARHSLRTFLAPALPILISLCGRSH